ncbi:MAG TPA: hypothetical protein VHB30_00410 [Solirubrobacteraceae bacterium]|nr:hypothetical protein [Solirubrobacteraceae bacterium]
MPDEPLDLGRPRDLAGLARATLAVQRRWFAVLFSVTAIVSVPVYLLVEGVWGRQLADGPDADASSAATAAILIGFVVTAAVAALHVRVVERLATGQEPTVGGALRAAAAALPAAIAVTALYVLGVAAGTLLLVIPGIWLAVRWSVATQAAVAEGLVGPAALARSAELVRGRWWVVLGRVIAAGVAIGIAIEIPVLIAGAVHAPWAYVAIRAVLDTVERSVMATFSVLLYFSLRADAHTLSR